MGQKWDILKRETVLPYAGRLATLSTLHVGPTSTVNTAEAFWRSSSITADPGYVFVFSYGRKRSFRRGIRSRSTRMYIPFATSSYGSIVFKSLDRTSRCASRTFVGARSLRDFVWLWKCTHSLRTFLYKSYSYGSRSLSERLKTPASDNAVKLKKKYIYFYVKFP